MLKIIRGRQIKTTAQYHYNATGKTILNVDKDVKPLEHVCCWQGYELVQPLKKAEHLYTLGLSNPTFRYVPKINAYTCSPKVSAEDAMSYKVHCITSEEVYPKELT